MELRPGIRVPIPCRQCAQAMTFFELREGISPLSCARCGQETRVEVYRDDGALRVRTAATLTADRPKAGRS